MPIADDEQEWEVEKIIDARKERGVQHYLVQWKGWPEEYTSWEPAENTSNAVDAIAEYEAQAQSRRTIGKSQRKRRTRN